MLMNSRDHGVHQCDLLRNLGVTYGGSLLLNLLARSSKVEAVAMAVAFIMPREKSTVALRAAGHLALWLLWRTSGLLVSDINGLNLPLTGHPSVVSSSFPLGAIPSRAATSGGGIRNSPVFTVVMNGFFCGEIDFLGDLRPCSASVCSCIFFNFALSTSLKSSVDRMMLGLIIDGLSSFKLSWLLLWCFFFRGLVWFDCRLARTRCSLDLLMRLQL